MNNHDEQAARPVAENELWLLSYYRSSEINGALFFGGVARTVRGPLQVDVTHHFSDEASHASYWTQCIANLGHTAIKQNRSYQDQYLEAVGAPASLMEVMAITQVFEKRVIGQYHQHLRLPGDASGGPADHRADHARRAMAREIRQGGARRDGRPARP